MGKLLANDRASGRRRIPAWLAHAGDALSTIFLPAACRLCEELLTRASGFPICNDCLASFSRIAGDVCHVCGRPTESVANDEAHDDLAAQPNAVCIGCRNGTFHFDLARSFARYDNSLVRAMVLLKFEEMDPLADCFADRLADVVHHRARDLQADLVVPVPLPLPLHKDRQRERGFNQAELLSKRVAKRLELPHQGVLLVRKRPRPDKHLLTSHERREAVRGAFATRPGSQVDNRHVLLVDDVMTTGATLDACAKALRDAGASAVLGLTVARATLDPRKVSR